MAAREPHNAIWLSISHSDAHEMLAAPNNPLKGEPRIT
jgi:hypothetical protein